ncbi:hypothetical protein MSG28_012793 [Choristoneura fumiferana]|uniref:Uncharacterized protein n=1 Tax=Choristoneura fumiferana TaxID=7141 RepID=A0ACC0JHY1_CHOFU|nr:hypothetical protein MSG28_012793 [Choristoneura fumiferana]
MKKVKKDDNDYLVTGYQVILFTDGSESKAYISSGGLMEDFISFTFICNQITTLSYRFWLYGTERESITARDPVRITC